LDGDSSIFKAACATWGGIYLWTFRQRSSGTHLIHYVGETFAFARRHREHLVHILGLNYGIIDAQKAEEGVCESLWRGLWRDRTPDGPSRQIGAYRRVHDGVLAYLSGVNVFFAELQKNRSMRRHIEGCVGWNLRNHHPDAKVLYPDDNHVGTMSARDHGELLITSTEPILGLDARIPY